MEPIKIITAYLILAILVFRPSFGRVSCLSMFDDVTARYLHLPGQP